MSRRMIPLANFSAGELSPKLRGRYDLQFYENGGERIENFICETQGPARYRNGTKYVASTKDDQIAVLIPFEFNDEQAYMLEFTNLLMRAYTADGGILVEDPKTITGITQANPAVVTVAAHAYTNGQEVFIDDVVGMTELNGKRFTIAGVTLNTYQLVGVDSTTYTAYSSGGESKRVFEVVTPYAEEDIADLMVAQDADTMFIAHVEYEPRKLIRATASTFTISIYTRTSDPFSAGNYPGAVCFYEQRLFYGGSLQYPQKIWGSKSDNYSDHTIGVDADDAFEYTLAADTACVIRWLAPTETQLVIGTSGGTFKAIGGQNDEPITPTGISIKPSGIFGVAKIPPVRTDNQILFIQKGQKTVRSYEFDFLQDSFINVDRNLTADHLADKYAEDARMTQTALQLGRPDIIWCTREDGELLGLTYKIKEQVSGWHRHSTRKNDEFASVGVLPRDGTDSQLWVVAKRIINGVTKRFVEYMEAPIVWPEAHDYYTGQLNKAADTENYLRDVFEAQKITYHLDAGGVFNSLVTTTTVTPAAVSGNSVNFTAGASIFSAADVGREIWAKAKNGRAKIIAYVSPTVVTCQIKVTFSDANLIPANEWYLTVDEVSGLDYLEGETVQVVTDGGLHPDCLVEDGKITLNYQASVVNFGFSYEGFIKTMRLETGLGTAQGVSQSKPINVSRLGILFYNSSGASYGTDLYALQNIPFRSSGDKMNRPAPAFSGFKDVQISNEWDSNKHIYISQRTPLPCVVQLIGAYEETSET